MSRFRFLFLIFFNLVGVVVSFVSFIHTERLNHYISENELICDIGRSISCSTTYLSDYAFIFHIPISLFSAVFFWFVLIFLVMNNGKKPRSYLLLSLMNMVALLVCLFYLYILFFELKTICLFCMLIDFIVLLNAILLTKYGIREFLSPDLAVKQIFIRNRLMVFSFAMLLVTGLVLYKAYQIINYRENKVFFEAHFMQQPVNTETKGSPIVWGNPEGDNEILIFNDFLCGYCKIANERYRKIVSNDFPDVKIEFISYPLRYDYDTLSGSVSLNMLLVKIMLAAGNDKNFWNFHDAVIHSDGKLDSTVIFHMASQRLDDFDLFVSSYSSPLNDYMVRNNCILASEYSITGTPSVFINGREFEEWTNIKLLKMILSNSDIKP